MLLEKVEQIKPLFNKNSQFL